MTKFKSIVLLYIVFGLQTGRAEDQVGRPQTAPKSTQHFECDGNYTIDDCRRQVDVLRAELRRYDVQRLGEWTWVVVHSDDWKPILRKVQRDEDSPAFTAFDKRATFIEEALLWPIPARRAELLKKWSVPLDKLLDYAVTHEMAHVYCNDRDERRAETYAKTIRRTGRLDCVDATSSGGTISVPIRLERGYVVVVSGSIGSLKSLNLVVDTGSVPTLVSRKVSDKLRLEGPEGLTSAWTDRTNARVVTLPEIAIGPLRKSGTTVLAMDMSPFNEALGMRIDAIVGLDVLAPTDFTIDYEHKLLTFGSSAIGTALPAELHRETAPHLMINGEISGKPARLLLDTGTNTVTLTASTGQNCTGPSLGADTFDGAARLNAGPVQNVRAGAVDFGEIRTSTRCKRSGEENDFDGLVGPRALGVKAISFDFGNGRIYLQR